MKKTFTLAITICLLLSFCLTSFASVSITHMYKGKSLIDGDTNEYFYTFAEYEGTDEADDFGVIINDKKYSVGKSNVTKTNEKKAYGIGIADPENTLGKYYIVTPYVTIGENDVFGEPYKVLKSLLYEKMNSEYAGEDSSIICDDTNSNTKRYDTWYTPTGIYMQTNIFNGLDYGYNEALNRALIQIDLTKFDGVDPTQPVILTVTGRPQYNVSTATDKLPESFTVNAYGFYDFDWSKSLTGYVAPEEGEEDTTEPVYEWSESTVNPSTGYIGPRLEEIYKMPVLDSFTVTVPENTNNITSGDVIGSWTEYEIDIKDIVAAALDAGETKATVVLLADNSERENIENKDESGNVVYRDEVMLVMGTKENTTASRRPTLSYYKYTDEYTNLSSIKVNGEEISGFNATTTDYTYGYLKTDDIPQVTAETYNEESRAVITQATAQNDYTATITVYDEQNIRSKTYTVTFEALLPSSSVSASDAISADTNSRTNQYSTWYTPTGIYMRTNIYNGAALNNGSNNSLQRALIKLDLTKFTDVDLTKPVNLTVVGQPTYTYYTDTTLKQMTVNAYADYNTSWDETTIDAASPSVGPGIADIIAMEKLDSFTVDVPAQKDGNAYVSKTVNVVSAVKNALAAGKNSVTIILLADNSERASLNANGGPDRNDLMFIMGTKENTNASRRPSLSYYKYDSEYTDLTSIEINGEAIEEFNAATYAYNSTFEEGTEIPVVTATAFDKDAMVSITQASAENEYTATITVSNATMTAKTYKVVFEQVAPSYETTVKSAITADAHSRITDILPSEISMYTNLYNGIPYASNNEATLRRGYMQVSVSQLANIDLTKKIYLNIYAKTTISDKYKTEYCPTSLNVNVYAAMKSDFEWNETTAAAVTANTFGPNLTEMKALPLVSVITVTEADYNTANYLSYQIDITDAIKTAITNSEEYVTFMFSADNSERNTTELQALKTENSDNRDNVTFAVLTKEREVESQQPSVTYFAFETTAAE